MPRYFSSIRSSFVSFSFWPIAPVAAGLLVQLFGERLGQPVGQRFDHDRVVIVVVRLELLHQFLECRSRPSRRTHRGNRALPRLDRRDVVGQAAEASSAPRAPIAAAASASGSASRRPRRRRCRGRCRRRRCSPGRSRRRAWACQRLVAMMSAQQSAAPCRTGRVASLPTCGSLKIAGYLPFSSHAMKNGDQSMYGTMLGQRKVAQHAACRGTPAWQIGACCPVDREAPLARPRRTAPACVRGACVKLRAPFPGPRGSRGRAQRSLGPHQAVDDADAARGVLDVDHRALDSRRDLDRRVLGAGRGAADQQRHLEAFALHLLGDVDHLVERRRDQAGQADHVDACFSRPSAGSSRTAP